MKKAGFSILEVLIALVVFAIGIGSLLTAMGYHLRDISAAQEHAQAIRIAEREMAALRRLEESPDEEAEGSEGGFSWITTAEDVDLSDFPELDSSSSETPVQLKVEVSWGQNRRVRLQGFEVFEN